MRSTFETMKKLLPILTLAFILTATPVFASQGKNSHKNDNESRFELKIRGDHQDNDRGHNNKNSEDEDEDNKTKIEIDNSEFEVRGEITSVSANSFVIAGQTINIDPLKVSEFEQKGILAVGNSAKVEGIIVDGDKFAEEIKLIGTGQGRFKFEIRGLTISASPTPGATPSASPDASPQASVSPSPSSSPSVSSDIRVKIKANGPLDQVVAFLQQILGFLTGLGSSPTPSPSPTPTPSPSVLPSPSASPEASPSPEVSPTPEVSPSPSVEPSPTASPEVTIEGQDLEFEEGQNPLENIINILEELIERLRNLL